MKMEEKIEKPTLAQLWQDIKRHKRLYYKVLPATFVVSAILTLSIPNYYHCTVMLAPELSSMGVKSSGALSSLASSFGINLGGASQGADALLPTLYPDLMNSVTFRASLFPIKVQREDDSTGVAVMTYYDYLKDGQKSPWWTAGLKALFSLFKSDEPENNQVNTFKLTKEQTEIAKKIAKKVVCDVDKKTMVITIDVEDQDPLICATIADSVQQHLQEFITNYRTKKARVDLAYNQKLFDEAKSRYEKARKAYAAYADANRNALFQTNRSEVAKLENEMNLQYQAYSQISAQLRLAEAKVQEDTPAFTDLQPATVPVKKSGPKRASTCLVILFLAFIATTLYVWHKSGLLQSLLASLRRDSRSDDFDEDDLLRALVKLSTTPEPPAHTDSSKK